MRAVILRAQLGFLRYIALRWFVPVFVRVDSDVAECKYNVAVTSRRRHGSKTRCHCEIVLAIN